jgi:hypothetical protein
MASSESTAALPQDGCLVDWVPAGVAPDEPHAVVITKPGSDAIRLGPLQGITAGAWAVILRDRQPPPPPGTTIEVVSFDPEAGTFIDPGSIPRSTADLLVRLLAGPGHPASSGFPNLYDQLVLVHGETLASQMWDQALRHAVEDATLG